MNATDSKALLKALDNFDAKTKTAKGAPDICGTYKLVKPVLAGILPFLAFLPVVGARIVKAISALMAGLDAYCPNA